MSFFSHIHSEFCSRSYNDHNFMRNTNALELPCWLRGQCSSHGIDPWSGRSPGEGNGNPLQYSCLENPMDGGASQATVYGVAKSWTQLSKCTHTTHAMSHSLSPGFYKINFFSSQTKFSQTKLSSS